MEAKSSNSFSLIYKRDVSKFDIKIKSNFMIAIFSFGMFFVLNCMLGSFIAVSGLTRKRAETKIKRDHLSNLDY